MHFANRQIMACKKSTDVGKRNLERFCLEIIRNVRQPMRFNQVHNRAHERSPRRLKFVLIGKPIRGIVESNTHEKINPINSSSYSSGDCIRPTQVRTHQATAPTAAAAAATESGPLYSSSPTLPAASSAPTAAASSEWGSESSQTALAVSSPPSTAAASSVSSPPSTAAASSV